MKKYLRILPLLVLLSLLILPGAPRNMGQQSSKSSTKKPVVTAAASNSANEGEKRFQVNCSRCHNPPDSLSPREVPAVIRHMRVRAMLSAEDEKLIRQYLAP